MFFDKQMKELFEILDVNKDGYIDLKDWQANFPEDIVCGSLQKIKDVIYQNRLKSEDVLNRLQLQENQLFVNFEQLSKGIKKMDFNLSDVHAEKIAKQILAGKKEISVKLLCEILQCVEDETLQQEWLDNTY